jgi:hypothetical protein
METRSDGKGITDLDVFVEELMDLLSYPTEEYIREHLTTLPDGFRSEIHLLHRNLLERAYATCTDKENGLTMYAGMIMMALRKRRFNRGL